MEMLGFALECLLAAMCFAVVLLISALAIFVIKWMVEHLSDEQ